MRVWRNVARWIWLVVPLVVAVVAYQHHDALVSAAGLLRRATLPWMLLGVATIAFLYLCRAIVYAVPLRLMGYAAPLPFLWGTAVTATSVHQLLPAGGATGYAFLTYAMYQRGVSGGEASLVALVDTLSYAAALASLVVASLIFLTITGSLHVHGMGAVMALGVAVLTVAGWLYYQQRDQRRFVAAVLRLKARLAARLGRDWPDGPVREFLGEYYRGKRLITRRPAAFAGMLGLQYVAVGCDAAALYAAFLALGSRPRLWIVLMGFVVAMAGVSIVSVPGGGGGFETLMSAFFTTQGIPASEGIAAAVLYRILAFWLPVAVSLLVLLRLRRRRKAIRPEERSHARPARARP
jgi:uncharacterized protein (TIRG00374 family)